MDDLQRLIPPRTHAPYAVPPLLPMPAAMQPVQPCARSNHSGRAAAPWQVRRIRRALAGAGLFLGALCGTLLPQSAQADGLFGLVGMPSVDISGYGWLDDLYLQHTLKVLTTSEEDPEPQIDAVFVEDALWIISGQVQQQGYLYPTISARMSDADGKVIYEGVWNEQELQPPLPSGLIGTHVLFTIDAGVRFYFESITIDGLPADLEEQPESFFYPTNQLLSLSSTRYYTRARGMSGLQAIVARLRAMGYREAKVTDQSASIDRKSGAVTFTAKIDHGPVYYVSQLLIQPHSPDVAAEVLEGIPLLQDIDAGQRLTPEWLQNNIQQVRNRYYASGHPEVTITVGMQNPHAPLPVAATEKAPATETTPTEQQPEQHTEQQTELAQQQKQTTQQQPEQKQEQQPEAPQQPEPQAVLTATPAAVAAEQPASAQVAALQPVPAQSAAEQPAATPAAKTAQPEARPEQPAATATAATTASVTASTTTAPTTVPTVATAEPAKVAETTKDTEAAKTAEAAEAAAPAGAPRLPFEETERGKVVRVVINVNGGNEVKIGAINFTGDEGTRRYVLEQQLTIEPGEELDRNSVENSRNKLASLGIFRAVEIDYTEVDAHTWDVNFDMQMKQRTAVSLLFGAGTFDIVRAGFIVEQNNLFGLAHSQRLRAVQSVKSTDVSYRYGIPQIFGQDLDLYAKGNYLYREEISFNRLEYGAAAGVQHYYRPLRTTFDVQYSLEQLNARNRSFLVAPGPTQATVAAVTLKATHNGVDNPIFPTKGWQIHGSAEFAVSDLGGQVNYQRVEAAVAYHTPLNSSGLILHTSLRHGVITTGGNPLEQIPVNRRFFMGGENTVRGYRRDQASPKDAQGNEIGAVSYVLWQGELEQRLTEDLSVVTFVDALGNAAEIKDYPFNETVVSIGLGFSYRTFVGPLRLEYGYNVKKRTGDPSGTVQVSIGFPF